MQGIGQNHEKSRGNCMNPLRHKFLPISFVIAVLGLFFSVYNILSVFLFEKVCTDNCSVFANFTIMGFSLWWLGAVFFAGILILSLFGCAYVIRILTAAALFFDIFLLILLLLQYLLLKACFCWYWPYWQWSPQIPSVPCTDTFCQA